MRQLSKGILLLLTLAFVAASVQGCNTIRGVGKDLEQGGKKIQDTADR